MLEFGLTIFLIISIFILGIIAFKLPILGILAVIIAMLTLTNTIASHTVIMGYIYNSTSLEIVTITQDMPELLYLGIVDILWCIMGTIIGIMSRRGII